LGNVDASKLSHVVGSDTNLESTDRRMSSNNNPKTAGLMIWNAVVKMRRFCSSQFFHSNSQNCAAFEIVMLTSDTELSSIRLKSTCTR